MVDLFAPRAVAPMEFFTDGFDALQIQLVHSPWQELKTLFQEMEIDHTLDMVFYSLFLPCSESMVQEAIGGRSSTLRAPSGKNI
jgi:hypothetical protein